MSPPSRGRELKYELNDENPDVNLSPPLAGAGIEMSGEDWDDVRIGSPPRGGGN